LSPHILYWLKKKTAEWDCDDLKITLPPVDNFSGGKLQKISLELKFQWNLFFNLLVSILVKVGFDLMKKRIEKLV
jgi:hypothetical protein